MVKRYAIVLGVMACIPAVALAASYNDGVGKDFIWQNASDLGGNFGQPIGNASVNDIFFPGTNFNVSASSGGPTVSTVSDTLTMDLIANAGLRFDTITLIGRGQYDLSGTSGAGNSVEADGTLTLNTLVGDPFLNSSSYNFFDDVTPKTAEPWQESTVITIPLGTGVTSLNMTVDQELTALAFDGGSTINLTFQITQVAVGIIPEPSSLALIGLGGIALLRRRR